MIRLVAKYLFICIICLSSWNILAMSVTYDVTGQCKLMDLPETIKNMVELKKSFKQVQNYSEIAEVRFIQQSSKEILVSVRCKRFIKNIEVKAVNISTGQVKSLLTLKPGGFFNEERIALALKNLQKRLGELGFFESKINYLIEGKQSVNLVIKVTTPPRVTLGNIIILDDQDYPLFDYKIANLLYKGKVASKAMLERVDGFIRRKVKEEGVFFFQLHRHPLQISKQSAVLRYSLKLGPRVGMSITADIPELAGEIRTFLQHGYLQENKNPVQDSLLKSVNQFLASKGWYYANFQVRIEHSVSRNGYPLVSIFLRVNHAQHIKIEELQFYGVGDKLKKELRDNFYKLGGELIQGGYYDAKYVDNFVEFLKKFFLRRGILYNKISKPVLDYVRPTKAHLAYRIELGDTFILRKFSLNSGKYNSELKALSLYNRVNNPFNPIDLKDDLKKILQLFLSKGYYFAKFHSLRPDDIVHYDYDANVVDINLQLDRLTKCRVSNLFVVGNKKTKRWVVHKILNISRDQLLTPELLRSIKERLLRSGNFSSVEIKVLYDETVGQDDYYRLFIRVKERKAGRITNSIGYRTDLGIKAESKLFYSNLFGGAKSFSAKLRLNRRLKSGLEDIRENVPNNLWEYNTSISIQDPFFLKSYFQVRATLATSRERFYRFDADITRATLGLRRQFKKYFSFILNYQLEKVRQYNADSSINEVSFNVGSLTPHFVFDYRDSAIQPSKGGKFDLTCELANPFLLSMDTNELTINYYKVIARNVFYLPTSFGTIAFLIAGGIEKNLSNTPRLENGINTYWSNGDLRLKGYIPSIKVFRLEGGYNIRGFSFDESNYLRSGEDISTKIVQDRAFFTLIKIEPRYFYSDNIVLSTFFDAGRVFYNQFVPLDLRASVGVSFKYVTPVGTIDLDYGIKLHRYTHDDSGRESFGRIHFSIGLF